MFRVRESESTVDFSNVPINKVGNIPMKMQKKIGKKGKMLNWTIFGTGKLEV